METAQSPIDRFDPSGAWSERLSSEGISHLGAGKNQQPHPNSRAIIFWNGEFPVGLNISNAFEDCASLASPLPLAGGRSTGASLKKARPVSVSLVICTRDRPKELARCLASLPAQTSPPDEVVVVDNASLTGETEQVCRDAGVRCVREPKPGLDIARNAGARASKGDIVAYTDDDVVLHPRWLERLVAAFDEPQIWAVTGLVLPAELATQAQWHFERYWGFGRGFQRIDFGPAFLQKNIARGCPTWEIGAGASMAFRRTAFDQAGFFDERLDVGAAGCSGDSEYWHRILCAGGICRYEPSAVAFHYHRREWTGLRKQIRAYMRGHAAALLVQFERSGRMGNLRRLFVSFPAFYFRRMIKQALLGRQTSNLLMRDEIAGLLSGIWFYLRTPRSKRTAAL